MTRTGPATLICLALGTLAQAGTQHAWIDAYPQRGRLRVEAGFGSPKAWDVNQAGRLVHGVFWIRTASGTEKQIAMPFSSEAGAYVNDVDAKESVAIFGAFQFGVVAESRSKPVMVRYFAKRLVGDPGDWRNIQGNKRMALEIIPFQTTDAAVSLHLTSNGRPVTEAELEVVGPNGSPKVLKVDENGQAALPVSEPGNYWIGAFRTSDQTGQIEGRFFSGVQDFASISFLIPASRPTLALDAPANSVDSKATPVVGRNLLGEQFEGFFARINVNHNDTLVSGSVLVAPNGKVNVKSQASPTVARQIEQAISDTIKPVVPAQTTSSTQRRQVTVVDYASFGGGRRFPRIFNVSVWDENGHIVSTRTVTNEWEKRGARVLPTSIRQVLTGPNRVEHLTIEFTNHRLGIMQRLAN